MFADDTTVLSYGKIYSEIYSLQEDILVGKINGQIFI